MSLRSYKAVPAEPVWSAWPRFQTTEIPRQMQLWLRDAGSLTRRVIDACPGKFRVRLLRQGWARSLPSEQRLLGLRHGRRALVREVELVCDGYPWIFARSIIPATTLQGPARQLAHLGEKPLGAILFANPSVHRGGTEYAELLPHHPLYRTAVAYLDRHPDRLWGRRTIYFIANRPLLVNEVFLPGTMSCMGNQG